MSAPAAANQAGLGAATQEEKNQKNRQRHSEQPEQGPADFSTDRIDVLHDFHASEFANILRFALIDFTSLPPARDRMNGRKRRERDAMKIIISQSIEAVAAVHQTTGQPTPVAQTIHRAMKRLNFTIIDAEQIWI